MMTQFRGKVGGLIRVKHVSSPLSPPSNVGVHHRCRIHSHCTILPNINSEERGAGLYYKMFQQFCTRFLVCLVKMKFRLTFSAGGS